MKNTIITINDLDTNEYFEIQKKVKSNRPRFKAIGARKMDGIKILTEMTVPEAYVFNMLKDFMDYRDNISHISPLTNQIDKNKFSKGYRLLNSKSLVKRIRRTVYMINPDLIQPKEYESAVLRWEELSS